MFVFSTFHSPAIPDLRPLLEVWVVAKDLHGRLRVGVEGGLEPKLRDADAPKELCDGADQVAQRQATVSHHSLHLQR